MSELKSRPHDLLIRLAIGYVFLLAGVQKWLFTSHYIDHFQEMSIPFPEVSVFIVALAETVCALLILANRSIHLATLPLLIIMFVAVSWVKLPLITTEGFWTMLNESRLDLLMILLLFYLREMTQPSETPSSHAVYGKINSR